MCATSMRVESGGWSSRAFTAANQHRKCKLNSRHARIIKYINGSIKSIRADNAVRAFQFVYIQATVACLRYVITPIHPMHRKKNKERAAQ